jgi:hypothetical protein
VSRSAVGIPHRRCILIRLNPLVASAGSSPTDPLVQGTSSLSAAAFPTSAARLRRSDLVADHLRCFTDQFRPSVSISTFPSPSYAS